MKEIVEPDTSFMYAGNHLTACFYDFEHDIIHWAPKCSCGSEVDEKHQCLAVQGRQ